MLSIRHLLAAAAMLVAAVPAGAGVFARKGKADFRVRQLVETLRTEPDESQRRAAVAELKEADPRTQLEVIPALVAALQRDAAETVRARAAEAIGQLKHVSPLAGLALETAAESDPSPAVRGAAQQALWEYHLGGYRSARGADGIAGQTAEPPLARPAVRPASAVEVVPVVPPSKPLPAATPTSRPRPVGLPTVTAPPPTTVTALRPAMAPPPLYASEGPRVILTAAPPPLLNVTDEPPIAKRADQSITKVE